MIVAAHHRDQPTCRLGIAASTFTSGGGWSGGVTVPKMWLTTSVSTIWCGSTNRGGATGSSQNTASALMLAPTSAERQRP